MSEAKYDTFHWFQQVADNLSHFKTTNSSDLILKKVDALAEAYVLARQSRFRVLLRQYVGSLTLQVFPSYRIARHSRLASESRGTDPRPISRSRSDRGNTFAQPGLGRQSECTSFITSSHPYTELDRLFGIPQDPKSLPFSMSIPRTYREGSRAFLLPGQWPPRTLAPF